MGRYGDGQGLLLPLLPFDRVGAGARAGASTRCLHVPALLGSPANINNPDISTNLDNLVSLCDMCHKKVHGWARQGSTRKGMAFDEDGNLIRLDSEHTD